MTVKRTEWDGRKLPEWIKFVQDCVTNDCPGTPEDTHKLIEALAIAIGALEELKNIRYESRAKDYCDESDYPARVALARIEKLGDSTALGGKE